jgi:hypothetical protein
VPRIRIRLFNINLLLQNQASTECDFTILYDKIIPFFFKELSALKKMNAGVDWIFKRNFVQTGDWLPKLWY